MGDIDQCTLFRMKATVNLNEANLTNKRAPGLVSTCIWGHLEILDATTIRQEGHDQTLDEY